VRALCAIVIAAIAGGCVAPAKEMDVYFPVVPSVRIDSEALTPKGDALPVGPDHFRTAGGWTVLGWSLEGRPIHCLLLGHGPEFIVVVGTVHGDEPAGGPLLRRLAAHLEAKPQLLEGKQIALVPVANPDGLAHGVRLNARGRDINRNFPSNNWRPGERRGPQALSEPETRALFHLLADRRPRRIVTVHQPMVGINWDGPGKALAREVAQAAGLPMLPMRERRGSIGSYAGRDRNIPVITFELPQSATRMRPGRLWARYGRALLLTVTWSPRRARADIGPRSSKP